MLALITSRRRYFLCGELNKRGIHSQKDVPEAQMVKDWRLGRYPGASPTGIDGDEDSDNISNSSWMTHALAIQHISKWRCWRHGTASSIFLISSPCGQCMSNVSRFKLTLERLRSDVTLSAAMSRPDTCWWYAWREGSSSTSRKLQSSSNGKCKSFSVRRRVCLTTIWGRGGNDSIQPKFIKHISRRGACCMASKHCKCHFERCQILPIDVESRYRQMRDSEVGWARPRAHFKIAGTWWWWPMTWRSQRFLGGEVPHKRRIKGAGI